MIRTCTDNIPLFQWLFEKAAFSLFPKWQILDAYKLKEYADKNFKFDETGKRFSKWVENNVFNSLPNNKTLDWSKFKALADNKIKVTEKLKILWEG